MTNVEKGVPETGLPFSFTNALRQSDEDTVMADYKRLLRTNGTLAVPNVTLSYNSMTNKHVFTQTGMEDEENAYADDLVYGVLLEKESGDWQLIQLRNRKEYGSVFMTLQYGVKREDLVVYTFATKADKTEVSQAQYLEPEEEI